MTDDLTRPVEDDGVREFVSRLSEALALAYRKHGGIASIARRTGGAATIRNIDVLEAAEVYRSFAAAPAAPAQVGEDWHMVGKTEAVDGKLIGAARALAAKLREVHADDRYRSVWECNQAHAGPYAGPTYTTELEVLETALSGDMDARAGEEGR